MTSTVTVTRTREGAMQHLAYMAGDLRVRADNAKPQEAMRLRAEARGIELAMSIFEDVKP